MDDDDWSMVNAVTRPDFHHDNPERGYWPMPRDDPHNPPIGNAIGPRGVFFNPKRVEAMKRMGFSKEDIEERYQLWLKEMEFHFHK